MGQRHLKEIKKYVVLRYLVGPNMGQKFWSTAAEDGGDNTRSAEGEVWYEEVLFTDSDEEAITACFNLPSDILPHEVPRGRFMARVSKDRPGEFG